MAAKLQLRYKNDFLNADIISINSNFVVAIIDRVLAENFVYDVKLLDLTGEQILKTELIECVNIQPRKYQIKLNFLGLPDLIKKKIDKAAFAEIMKKFQFAVARAVSQVLEKVLKTAITDIKYKLEEIEKYHFVNSIVVSVVGEISGSAILDFGESIKVIIAQEMWAFAQIELTQESIMEALKEFVNYVLGGTVTILSNNMGVKTNIKAPIILNDKYINANENLTLHQLNILFKYKEAEHNITLIFLH